MKSHFFFFFFWVMGDVFIYFFIYFQWFDDRVAGDVGSSPAAGVNSFSLFFVLCLCSRFFPLPAISRSLQLSETKVTYGLKFFACSLRDKRDLRLWPHADAAINTDGVNATL
ncbi:hypothetical protein F5Y12DRAFT_30792 [Xylaria sp. FL1777]|nr:hypothetical protein F5Y12DRAFT_30792 [Xylaria sp. FL1777]